MRISFVLSIAAALGVLIAGWSGPSAATDLKGALGSCNKHGGCEVHGSKNGVNIRYNGNEIHCPYKGECKCLMCGAPPKRVNGPGGGGKSTAGLPKTGGGTNGPVIQQKPGPVGGPVIRNSGGPATNANFAPSGGRSGGGSGGGRR